jgi:6,7-dimethyl-8-ribityllumazine synthase
MTEPLEYPYAAKEQATDTVPAEAEPGPEAEPDHELSEPAPEPEPAAGEAEPAAEAEPTVEPALETEPAPLLHAREEHAAGGLEVPDGYGVLEGTPTGARRGVAVVVARFNAAITTRLLASALEELDRAGVARDAITIVPVPGAFELPLAAMAFAKTRRYAGVVALGCVIRGETAHFEYVAGEAASGLQLAALETGVPVAFGVLTTETVEQAEARVDKGAEAVRTALEMADLFAQLRTAAAAR